MDKQAQIEHGGPAFPCDRINVDGGVVCTTGMTLRDHFGYHYEATPQKAIAMAVIGAAKK